MRSAAKEKARAAWFQVGDAARLQLHHTPWWRHLYRDFRRYRATGESVARTLLMSQGLWASSVYRLARAATRLPRPLRAIAAPVFALAQKLAEILTGISIPPRCEIGEGLYIGHFGPVIIDEKVRIGHNCNLGQSVTLAEFGSGAARGAPTIGNRVFIGAHSLVVGKIVVGDDAVICAGSVVTKSVPARGVVLGNPARLVSVEGSFEYVVYDGMRADTARSASISSTVIA
jgi:serine O-acetyltransferase